MFISNYSVTFFSHLFLYFYFNLYHSSSVHVRNLHTSLSNRSHVYVRTQTDESRAKWAYINLKQCEPWPLWRSQQQIEANERVVCSLLNTCVPPRVFQGTIFALFIYIFRFSTTAHKENIVFLVLINHRSQNISLKYYFEQ